MTARAPPEPYSPFDVLAIPLRGRHWIEASAGTGKTHAIAELYLRLLMERDDLAVENILVLTYTTAAAAELRDRIRQRLVQERAVMRSSGTPDLLVRFDSALAEFDRAPIGTIHAFCLRQLQVHALDCGVPGSFVVEPSTAEHDEELARRIVREWLRNVGGRILPAWALELAQPRELSAVVTVAARLGDVRLEPPPEWPVEPSADDEALARAVEAARRWLNIFAAHLGPHGSRRIAARKTLADDLDAFRRWLETLPAPPTTWDLAKDKNLAACERLANMSVTSEDPPALVELRALAHQLTECAKRAATTAHAWAARLRSHVAGRSRELRRSWFRQLGILGYDELIQYVRDAMGGPSGVLRARRWAQEFRVALVDEFQDTDPAQYDILDALAQQGMDLYLIGDPKQSIYAFRGADIFTYRAASRAPGIRRYTMDRNWRSSPGLVEAVQHLFRRPQAFALDFVQMLPVTPAPQADRLHWDPRGGAPCSIWWLPSCGGSWKRGAAQKTIARFVAHRIVRWLEGSDAARLRTEDGHERPLSPADIAVLVPRHQEAAVVARALRQAGVPVAASGMKSVFDTEDADYLRVLLRSLLEPRREDYLRAAALTPPLGRAPCDLADPDSTDWAGLAERWIEYHRLWTERGVRVMLDALWIRERCIERLLRRPDGPRRVTNLRHLTDLLARAELDERLGPAALMRYFTLQIEAADANYEEAQLRLDDDHPRVRVTTIHQSKGLQYPVVVLPYLWSLGPRSGQSDEPVLCHDDLDQPRRTWDFGSPQYAERVARARLEEFQEAIRLTYVAVTRAQAHVVLVWGPIVDTSDCPLAWLWHAAESDAPATPVPGVPDDAVQMREDLERLAATSNGSIEVQELDLAELAERSRWRAVPPQGPLTPPRTFQGVLDDGWRILSYSSLRSGHPDLRSAEEPDYDNLLPSDVDRDRPPSDERFQFPAGAAAGQVLHSLLETVRPDDTAEILIQRARARLEAAGLDPQWAPVAARIVLDALNTPLDDSGWTLRDVQPARAARELPFLLQFVRHPPVELVRRLRRVADAAEDAVPAWMFEPAHGFLRGFIDLVFEHEGRWYVVDYKSNWLGPDWEDYRSERLAEEMRRADYELQAMLYSVAVRQLARARGIGDREFSVRWGGVFYLFLRGLSPARGPTYGVYAFRPAPEELGALGNHLVGEESAR